MWKMHQTRIPARFCCLKIWNCDSLAFPLVFAHYTSLELQLADFGEIQALEKSGSCNWNHCVEFRFSALGGHRPFLELQKCLKYVGPYPWSFESVVKYVGPYPWSFESVVKYMGPCPWSFKSVAKYVGPYAPKVSRIPACFCSLHIIRTVARIFSRNWSPGQKWLLQLKLSCGILFFFGSGWPEAFLGASKHL